MYRPGLTAPQDTDRRSGVGELIDQLQVPFLYRRRQDAVPPRVSLRSRSRRAVSGVMRRPVGSSPGGRHARRSCRRDRPAAAEARAPLERHAAPSASRAARAAAIPVGDADLYRGGTARSTSCTAAAGARIPRGTPVTASSERAAHERRQAGAIRVASRPPRARRQRGRGRQRGIGARSEHAIGTRPAGYPRARHRRRAGAPRRRGRTRRAAVALPAAGPARRRRAKPRVALARRRHARGAPARRARRERRRTSPAREGAGVGASLGPAERGAAAGPLGLAGGATSPRARSRRRRRPPQPAQHLLQLDRAIQEGEAQQQQLDQDPLLAALPEAAIGVELRDLREHAQQIARREAVRASRRTRRAGRSRISAASRRPASR